MYNHGDPDLKIGNSGLSPGYRLGGGQATIHLVQPVAHLKSTLEFMRRYLMKERFAPSGFTMTLLAVSSLLALLPAHINGQDKKAKTGAQRYLILDTRQFKTMQKEIDEATSAGYRLISGNAGHMIFALEKDPDGKQHQYLVTGSIFKMAKEGKIEGYRVLPFAFSGGRWNDLGAVLEKLLPGEKQSEYKVVWTAKTSTFMKEIGEWAGKGFSLVALSGVGGNFALMERAAGAPESGPADRYVVLATTMKGTMEKELTDAVARGYRLATVAEAGDEMMFALEKRAPSEAAPEYRLITTTRTGKLEREVLAGVADGYRLLPMALSAQDRYAVLGRSHEMVAIMEKSPNQLPIQYKFLATKRVAKLQKELADEAAAGWSLNRLFLTYEEQMILLEKR